MNGPRVRPAVPRVLVAPGFRRRWSAVWAATALAVASLTGCATQVCNEAARWPPGVWLDASPWLAAHPGASLSACLNERCKKADAGATSVLQLIISNPARLPQPGKATYLLTVTAAGATPLKVQARVTLHRSQVRGPCGTETWWQADARLSAAGHISIWHGKSGPFAPQVPRAITPTPAAGL